MTERDPDCGEGRDPIDEEAAWAEIVAGYGEEPADPPGVWPVTAAPVQEQPGHAADAALVDEDVSRGPRDWEAGDDQEDEHFVPPEPPPLPPVALATKLAWLALLGGPLLLIGAVLLQQELTWWVGVLGVGGFLGGCATLVARMRGDDDDRPEPGGGAVV